MIVSLARIAGVDPAPYLEDDVEPGGALREESPPRPQAPASPATTGTGLDDKVLHALRNGPLPPKAIREATRIKVWTLPDVMARLVAAKKVKKIGERRGLQYALP